MIFYTEAIKLNDQEAIYFSNRSAAYYNLEQFENALQDATQALILNPQFLKAYYRKAASLYELDRLLEAKHVIEEGKKIGENTEIEKILARVLKEHEMVRF